MHGVGTRAVKTYIYMTEQKEDDKLIKIVNTKI